MKMPDRKSLTRLWAPKPMATPAMPAPAMSGPRLTPSSPRIMVDGDGPDERRWRSTRSTGPASGPGRRTAGTATASDHGGRGAALQAAQPVLAVGCGDLGGQPPDRPPHQHVGEERHRQDEQDVGGGGQQLVGRLGPRLAVGRLEHAAADERRVVAAGAAGSLRGPGPAPRAATVPRSCVECHAVKVCWVGNLQDPPSVVCLTQVLPFPPCLKGARWPISTPSHCRSCRSPTTWCCRAWS